MLYFVVDKMLSSYNYVTSIKTSITSITSIKKYACGTKSIVPVEQMKQHP